MLLLHNQIGFYTVGMVGTYSTTVSGIHRILQWLETRSVSLWESYSLVCGLIKGTIARAYVVGSTWVVYLQWMPFLHFQQQSGDDGASQPFSWLVQNLKWPCSLLYFFSKYMPLLWCTLAFQLLHLVSLLDTYWEEYQQPGQNIDHGMLLRWRSKVTIRQMSLGQMD